jgi:hypothetical protein
MATMTVPAQAVRQFEILKDEEIAAPIDIVFETILEQMGPDNETPDGKKLLMKLEAWPGGRWFRDLGNNTGHLWGHVQAIKLEHKAVGLIPPGALDGVRVSQGWSAMLMRVREMSERKAK